MAANGRRPVHGVLKKGSQILTYAGQLLMAAILFVIYIVADRKTIKITSSGVEREYLLHVPRSYNPANPTPLVITIHGFAEWPAHVMHISGWNTMSDQAGFLVAYPSGTGFPKHWRVMEKPGSTAGAHLEVKFITDLISHLEQTFNIDQSRIFANGFSNGGGMTHVLAEEVSEKIAAIGIIAGALVYPFQNNPSRRQVPLIAFHGSADPVVPIGGGPSRYFAIPFPDIPEWVEKWANQNGFPRTPVQIFRSAHVNGIQYADPSHHKDVIFYTIEDGGHTWPGGLSIQKFLAGKTTFEISATELMWQFFEQHPLQ